MAATVAKGLPWFDRFHCMESFLELLTGEESCPAKEEE